MLQPNINVLVDDPKTPEAIKRKIKGLILEYIECIEFSLKCFG